MVMVTSQELKNEVEIYIKTTKVKYMETTSQMQKKIQDIDWQFLIGQALHITKLKSRDDRVLFTYPIGFGKNKDAFDKIIQADPEFINNLNELIMLKGCSHKWVMKDKKIEALEINTYIDVEELNRPNFFKTWETISSVSIHVERKVGIKMNPQSIKPTDLDTLDKSMYG